MAQRKEIHERVLNARSTDELIAAYAEWADSYDHDLVQELGYVAPMITVALLQKYVGDQQALILDAGCGTGLVGELLAQNGYQKLEGLDYSADMLQKAGEKGVYSALHQADLTKTLTIADNRYDAVISVGTFTCGHVGPTALHELIRITRPGGSICFTVRKEAWDADDYRDVTDALAQRGAWKLQEEHDADYIQKEEGSQCKVCLYQVM